MTLQVCPAALDLSIPASVAARTVWPSGDAANAVGSDAICRSRHCRPSGLALKVSSLPIRPPVRP